MTFFAFFPVLDSLLSGFCLYSLFYALFRNRLIEQKLYDVDRWDRLACLSISIVGILLFIQNMVFSGLWNRLIEEEYERYAFMNRLTGPYWFSYWGIHFSALLITQFHWIKLLRKSRAFRILAAFVLIFPVQEFIVSIIATRRDYLPSSFTLDYLFPTVSELISTGGAFFICVLLLYLTPIYKSKQPNNEPEKIH